MNKMTSKRRKFLPFLKSRANRIFFIAINIYLIAGAGSLVGTIIYLAGHLDQTDKIIIYCIPGFVLGISSGIIYLISYQRLISAEKAKGHLHIF
jgi:hypothetical protein